jgi:site-specific recombinase XerC
MAYARNVLRDPPKTLSEKQQKRILEVTGEHVDGFRDFVILSVALGTFLREHEIAALNVGDVGQMPPKGEPSIKSKIQLLVFKRPPKRKKKAKGKLPKHIDLPVARTSAATTPARQRVFVPKSVRRKLTKFFTWKKKRGEPLGPGDALFLSRRGDRLSTRMMRHMFQQWQRVAGFEELFSFHILRHTGISNLYRKTKDLELTRLQARHGDVDTTTIYTHLSDHEIAAAIEDLDA